MFLQNFLQDVRIGLRVLVKEKGFCALAAGVLALGICAVTTQFAVVDGVLLRGVNFARAEQLVDIQLVDPTDFKPSNFNSRITTWRITSIPSGLSLRHGTAAKFLPPS